VAAFDFDGTVTRRDTLLPFLARLRGRGALTTCLFAAAPARRQGRDAYKVAVLRGLLAGLPADRFHATATAYGQALPARFRPHAVERIRHHQRSGHEVVLVSASLRAYLDPVVEHLGLDGVCAVEVEVGRDGRLTGEIVGANCRGPEKVRRLHDWLGGTPPERLWAYGDSSGDTELLAAADEACRVRRGARW
jgi:phosphatidylglycerophosphatase C